MLSVLVGLIGFTGQSWSIVMAGDLMLNAIPIKAMPLAGVAAPMRAADVALANLEIPLTNARKATTLKSAAEVRSRSQFILKADPKHAPGVAAAGVRMTSMASNHQMDYLGAGAEECRSALEKAGIVVAGVGKNAEEAFEPAVYTTKGGKRIGLISALAFMGRGAIRKTGPASVTAPGIATLPFDGRIDDAAKTKLKHWIGMAHRKCDVVVLALHWGIERQTMPTPYQVSLGRTAIDCGADIVWGHHPHVWQPMEFYRGKPILYSTGNLVSPLPSRTGLLRIQFGGNGDVAARFLPANCSGGRTQLLTGKRAATEVKAFARLCASFQKRYPNQHSKSP